MNQQTLYLKIIETANKNKNFLISITEYLQKNNKDENKIQASIEHLKKYDEICKVNMDSKNENILLERQIQFQKNSIKNIKVFCQSLESKINHQKKKNQVIGHQLRQNTFEGVDLQNQNMNLVLQIKQSQTKNKYISKQVTHNQQILLQLEQVQKQLNNKLKVSRMQIQVNEKQLQRRIYQLQQEIYKVAQYIQDYQGYLKNSKSQSSGSCKKKAIKDIKRMIQQHRKSYQNM